MTAVISMLDDWAQDLEEGVENAILVLDQSAAYDVICHSKLLDKLKIFGCDRNTLIRAQTEPDLCISVFTIILVNIILVSSEPVPV